MVLKEYNKKIPLFCILGLKSDKIVSIENLISFSVRIRNWNNSMVYFFEENKSDFKWCYITINVLIWMFAGKSDIYWI